jgi:hypothetical protein
MARRATLFQNTFPWGNVKIWETARLCLWQNYKLLFENSSIFTENKSFNNFYCELATAVIKVCLSVLMKKKNQL